MKAIKLYDIKWDLSDISPEEKSGLELPTKIGFKADDDFSVVDRVPNILKKKFGYNIIDFSFNEFHIAKDICELLLICGDKDKKDKLFKANGELSNYGTLCLDKLEELIDKRCKLLKSGRDIDNMPKLLDTVSLGLESVLGVSIDDLTFDQIKKRLIAEIHLTASIKKSSRKKVKSSYDPGEDEEEDLPEEVLPEEE